MDMTEIILQMTRHATMVPMESAFTLPLVEKFDNDLIITRLVFFTYLDPTGTVISTPQYIVRFNWSTELFHSLERTNLVLKNLPLAPWLYEPVEFSSHEAMQNEFGRLWSIYDQLIKLYGIGDSSVFGSNLGSVAQEFLTLFSQHTEKPLVPYYEHFGGEFLNWVRGISD